MAESDNHIKIEGIIDGVVKVLFYAVIKAKKKVCNFSFSLWCIVLQLLDM